jgi:hypothetical protein
MLRRAPILILAMMALFGLQFAECLSPVSAGGQTMQCCGSMPCNPTNQAHDCCKTMVSANESNVLPAEHSFLSVPVAAVAEHLSTPEVPVSTQVFHSRFEAPEHLPPELYTLHSSLLI